MPVDLAPILAWWVGMLFITLGAYLIFPCERSDPALMGFGLISAILGVSVFMTVRSPDWVPDLLTQDVLLTITLVALFLLGLEVARLLWRHYALKAPTTRLKELAFAGAMWVVQTIEHPDDD